MLWNARETPTIIRYGYLERGKQGSDADLLAELS